MLRSCFIHGFLQLLVLLKKCCVIFYATKGECFVHLLLWTLPYQGPPLPNSRDCVISNLKQQTSIASQSWKQETPLCSLYTHQVLPFIPRITQVQHGGHVCSPALWSWEAEGSKIQGHLELHREFAVILGYMKHTDHDKHTANF